MKTKEELNAQKEEVETLNKKLAELTEEELAQVSGGSLGNQCGEWLCPNCDHSWGPHLPLMRRIDGKVICPSCRNYVEPVWKEINENE